MNSLNGLNQNTDNTLSEYKSNFKNARGEALGSHGRFNIGTYKERSQHLILKKTYEPDESCHEITVFGHIADIKNNSGIIEIQTSSFGNLIHKLSDFLKSYNVKIVYPCPVRSRISWTDPDTGETSVGYYRSYPKRVYGILPELLRISEFFGKEGLSVDIVFTAVTEKRLLDGYGADKKKRSTKSDTVPDEILDIVTLKNCRDIIPLLPFPEDSEITNVIMEKLLGLKRKNLWMAVKFLETADIIRKNCKKGNTNIYILNNGGNIHE